MSSGHCDQRLHAFENLRLVVVSLVGISWSILCGLRLFRVEIREICWKVAAGGEWLRRIDWLVISTAQSIVKCQGESSRIDAGRTPKASTNSKPEANIPQNQSRPSSSAQHNISFRFIRGFENARNRTHRHKIAELKYKAWNRSLSTFYCNLDAIVFSEWHSE